MSEEREAVLVAEVQKSARLAERELIEAGLDRRLKTSNEHQLVVIGMQQK